MGKIYIANSGGTYETKKIYIGDSNNIAREVKKIYIGDTQNIARDVWSSKVEPITFTLTSGFTAGSAKVDTFVNPLSSDFDNCKTVNGSYSYDPGSSSSANYWIAIKFTPEQKQTLINMGYKNVHAEASFSFGGDTYASSYAHIYLITLYGNYISQYIYRDHSRSNQISYDKSIDQLPTYDSSVAEYPCYGRVEPWKTPDYSSGVFFNPAGLTIRLSCTFS